MSPGQVPKRGRGGTPASRQRMLHALVHTESWAVDLAWDVIARFGNTALLPRAFFDDFVAVAADEARHYSLLQACFVPMSLVLCKMLAPTLPVTSQCVLRSSDVELTQH